MTSHIAHLPDRSVRYLDSGGGRAFVLLHAFPLSADQWLPLLARLPAGWRAVAPDLRGFRGAGPAFEQPGLDAMTIDAYAGDVAALMAHLDLDRAVVAGVSMGGYIALALWRRAPARVAGLVLANTRAGADTPEGRAARDRTIEAIAREGTAPLVRDMPAKLLGETTRREQPDLEEAVARMIAANPAGGLVAALRAIKERPDSTPDLASITCPTLVVSGGEDAIIPAADAEALAAGILGARHVVLARTGHLSNLEDPLGFRAALVSQFAG